MKVVRRFLAWLLVRLAVVLALPVLLVFLVFAAVMALLCEGPAELLWWADCPDDATSCWVVTDEWTPEALR